MLEAVKPVKKVSKESSTMNFYLKNSVELCKKIVKQRQNLSLSILSTIEKDLYKKLNSTSSADLKGCILEILTEAYHFSSPPLYFFSNLKSILEKSSSSTTANVFLIILPVFASLNTSKEYVKVKDPINLSTSKTIFRKFWLYSNFFKTLTLKIIKNPKSSYEGLLLLWMISFSREAVCDHVEDIIDTLIPTLKFSESKNFRVAISILLNFHQYKLLEHLNLTEYTYLIELIEKKEKEIKSNEALDVHEELLVNVDFIKKYLSTVLEKKLCFEMYMEDLNREPLEKSKIHQDEKFWSINMYKLFLNRHRILEKYKQILLRRNVESSIIVMNDLNKLLCADKYKKEIVEICNDLEIKKILYLIYKEVNQLELKLEMAKVLNNYLAVEWEIENE